MDGVEGGGGVSSCVYKGNSSAEGEGGGMGIDPCRGGMGMGSGDDAVETMVTSLRTC